jgi:hypothetical protein
MELAETIDSINRQLEDLFGVDTITGQAIWRVAWSEDQFEHRRGIYTDYSPGGLYIRTVNEVRYVPKYRQWIKEKYVLERLVVIPEASVSELPGIKVSYEPIYPFETATGEYLPPTIGAAKFAVDLVYAAQGRGSLAKYKDPLAGMSTEDFVAMRKAEIDTLQKELFGNETDAGDAMAHGEAIIVPRNYERES